MRSIRRVQGLGVAVAVQADRAAWRPATPGPRLRGGDRGIPASAPSGDGAVARVVLRRRSCRPFFCSRKAATNLRKHGVSFDEAKTAFDDEHGAYYPDALHETRFILIGYSRTQRLVYVVHAEVDDDVIRIISARKATKNEKAHYEND
jgi:hypothetical protein